MPLKQAVDALNQIADFARRSAIRVSGSHADSERAYWLHVAEFAQSEVQRAWNETLLQGVQHEKIT